MAKCTDILWGAYRYALDILFPGTAKSCPINFYTPEGFLSLVHISESIRTETAKSAELIACNKSPALASVTSLFPYRHPAVRTAIWELKYRRNERVAHIFGALLYDILADHLSDAFLFSGISKPLLIPIPSSATRLRERGWNQTELLAQKVAQFDRDNFFAVNTEILIKARDTPAQATLKRAARFENVSDCFSINPKIFDKINKSKVDTKNSITDKDIILLDDVATTGSTLEAAAEVLVRHGARSVCAFTIAH